MSLDVYVIEPILHEDIFDGCTTIYNISHEDAKIFEACVSGCTNYENVQFPLCHQYGKSLGLDVCNYTYDKDTKNVTFTCWDDYKGYYNHTVPFSEIPLSPPSDSFYVTFTSSSNKNHYSAQKEIFIDRDDLPKGEYFNYYTQNDFLKYVKDEDKDDWRIEKDQIIFMNW